MRSASDPGSVTPMATSPPSSRTGTTVATSGTTVDSPLGPLRLVARDGALVGVYFTDHHPAPVDLGADLDGETPGAEADLSVLREAARQIGEYLAGRRDGFDLPTAVTGTEFQRAVWAALAGIPRGSTRTYGDLAREVGRPSAVRAVGAAVGRNPLSIVVPCHRVIGAEGRITGYAGGVDRKRALLTLESAATTLTG